MASIASPPSVGVAQGRECCRGSATAVRPWHRKPFPQFPDCISERFPKPHLTPGRGAYGKGGRRGGIFLPPARTSSQARHLRAGSAGESLRLSLGERTDVPPPEPATSVAHASPRRPKRTTNKARSSFSASPGNLRRRRGGWVHRPASSLPGSPTGHVAPPRGRTPYYTTRITLSVLH
jgi:hypothetical protein